MADTDPTPYYACPYCGNAPRVVQSHDGLSVGVVCTHTNCKGAPQIPEGRWNAWVVREQAARIAELTAENERQRQVIEDYGRQIIEARRLREAEEAQSGQPLAWLVWTPDDSDGSDYSVFACEPDAKDYIDRHNSNRTEDEKDIGPAVPLYTREPVLAEVARQRDAARAEVERLKGEREAAVAKLAESEKLGVAYRTALADISEYLGEMVDDEGNPSDEFQDAFAAIFSAIAKAAFTPSACLESAARAAGEGTNSNPKGDSNG